VRVDHATETWSISLSQRGRIANSNGRFYQRAQYQISIDLSSLSYRHNDIVKDNFLEPAGSDAQLIYAGRQERYCIVSVNIGLGSSLFSGHAANHDDVGPHDDGSGLILHGSGDATGGLGLSETICAEWK